MSKILRRPMFRGGPVDSRGTGITANLGYQAGGRVGYEKGDLVLGGDLYQPADFSKFVQSYKPNMSPALINNLFDRKTGELKPGMTYEDIFQATEETEDGKVIPKSIFDAGIFDFSKVGIEGDKSDRVGAKMIGKDKFADALKTDVLDKLKESKAYEPEFRGGGADAAQEDFGKEKLDIDVPEQNEPSNTEISAKDLIRENAELFKELLGEGQKEKIKKARIQDISDVGLDIFAQSQKEGATVGSTLGGAAERLVGKESRVEKAIAANEKIDQTGTVLAINDYISGKRSKEDIQKALSIAAATAKMKEGSIGDQILAVAARQTLTGGKIKEILGAAVGDNEAKGIRTIPAGQEGNYKPGPEDEGFFIFEEGTKNVFKFEDGVLKNVYRPN
jgi:hypothetical protein